MSLKAWLTISVVANGLLIAILVTSRATNLPATGQAANYLPHPGASESASPAPDDATLNSELREKVFTLAVLEAEARAANPLPEIEYWRSTGEAELVRYEERAERQRDEIRQRLISRYGKAAVDDPAFMRLFKPLNATFPYLSSKAQISLARLQRSRRAPPMQAGPSTGSPRDPAFALEQQRVFENELRQALSAAEFAEYQMRDSMLARQLRSSGVIQSDEEFRESLATLQQIDPAAGAAGYMQSQSRLKSILGEDRYVRFSATRDPLFPAIEAAGLRRQLTHEQVLATYGVVLRAQNDLVAAAGDRGASGQSRSGASPQEIIEGRDAEIARLVGETAAREMMESYSNGMVAASLRVMNGAR